MRGGQCGGWCGPAYINFSEKVTLRQSLRAGLWSSKLRHSHAVGTTNLTQYDTSYDGGAAPWARLEGEASHPFTDTYLLAQVGHLGMGLSFSLPYPSTQSTIWHQVLSKYWLKEQTGHNSFPVSGGYQAHIGIAPAPVMGYTLAGC